MERNALLRIVWQFIYGHTLTFDNLFVLYAKKVTNIKKIFKGIDSIHVILQFLRNNVLFVLMCFFVIDVCDCFKILFICLDQKGSEMTFSIINM